MLAIQRSNEALHFSEDAVHRRRVCNQHLHICGQVIEGDGNVIFGDDNLVNGDRNNVYGDRNIIIGSNNYVRGRENSADSGNIVVVSDEAVSSQTFDQELLQFFGTTLQDVFGYSVPVSIATDSNSQSGIVEAPISFVSQHSAPIVQRPRARRAVIPSPPPRLLQIQQQLYGAPIMQRRQREIQDRERSKRINSCRNENQRLRPDNDRVAAAHESSCMICFTNVPCTIFRPCNHMCCCAGCALHVDKCPICNEQHEGVEQVFLIGRNPENQQHVT